MEVFEDVFYRADWRGKQALAAEAKPPASIEEAVRVVLKSVFTEFARFSEHHEHEEAFTALPIAALMLNASNRLPQELAEIVRSTEWLRSEARQHMYELDENLRTSISQTEP